MTTTESGEVLKACPFCGAPAEIERESDHHGSWFNLGCSRHWGKGLEQGEHCPAGRIWYTEDPDNEAEAIKAWNTRPPEVAVRVDGGSSGASLPAHASPLRSAAATETQHSAGKPWDLYGPLADLTASLEALIDESDGVYGLHKNGDPAPWEELLSGGRFEDWLRALADARKALDAETAYRGSPPGELWIGGDDAADAARYRHLKEHHSYYYAEQYDQPQPREFGIQWEHQDCTPDRPSMDWLIDQDIEAKRREDFESRSEAWGYDPAERGAGMCQGSVADTAQVNPATDEQQNPPPKETTGKVEGEG